MASTTCSQLRRGLGFILALLMLVQLNLAPAFALSGFEVVSGDVTLSQTGNTYNITSNSAQAIVQWQTFNVNSNQTVNFLLPTTSSSIFNRVLNGQSNIMGNLNSNGIVLLSNTGGINIGATANINTGGFVASTLDMTNGNYLTNNWVFSRADGTSAAGIINEGSIHAGTGGFVVLAGGAVLNTGNIFAPEGTIHLVAGDEIRIDLGNHAVDVTITEALKEQIDGYQSAIETDGLLDARVIHLQAELMESFYAQTINNEGMIRATTSSNLGRSIRMYSFSEDQLSVLRNGGTLDVSGNELVFNGGTLEMVGDKVLQEGMVNADAYDGGTGGSILITSKEQTVLASGSVTSASGGVGTGDAGEIIIWSDKDTYFENGATIDVSGGDVSGDGGFVEVSGYETVYYEGQAYGGSVDGEAGSILIDPLNIIIVAAGVDAVTGGDAPAAPDEAFAEDPGATMNFDPQAGGAFNGFGDIHLQATNDITVNSAFDTSVATGNPSVSLTLEANNDININAAVTTHNANLTLLADADLDLSGDVNVNANMMSNGGDINVQGEVVQINGVTVDSGGGVITMVADPTVSTPNDLVIAVGSTVDSKDGLIDLTAEDVVIHGSVTSGTGLINIHPRDQANVTATGTVLSDTNITLDSTYRVDVSGSITSTGGNVSLIADRDGSGNGYFTQSGTITTNGGAITISGASDVSLSPAVNLTSGSINSNGGTITITGDNTSAWCPGCQTPNTGVYQGTAHSINSGGGVVDITGDSANNTGVRIHGNIASSGGNLLLTGTGRPFSGGLDGWARGVDIENGVAVLVDTDGGDIIVNGTADSAFTHYTNAQIRTRGGNFIVTGNGPVTFGSDLDTGGGNIIATSTGSSVNFRYDTGTGYLRADVATSGGNISLSANGSSLVNIGNPSPTIVDLGNTGTMNISPLNPASDIGLGGGGGAFAFTDASLDLIQNGTVAFGNGSQTGNINVGALDTSGQNVNLALQTGGNITDTNGAAMNLTTDGHLTLTAGGAIGTDTDPLDITVGGIVTGQAAGQINGVALNLAGSAAAINVPSVVPQRTVSTYDLVGFFTQSETLVSPLNGTALFNNIQLLTPSISQASPRLGFILRSNALEETRNQVQPEYVKPLPVSAPSVPTNNIVENSVPGSIDAYPVNLDGIESLIPLQNKASIENTQKRVSKK